MTSALDILFWPSLGLDILTSIQFYARTVAEDIYKSHLAIGPEQAPEKFIPKIAIAQFERALLNHV